MALLTSVICALSAQSFFTYFCLCAIYGTIVACRPSDRGLISVFRERGWKYFLIALIDVEANYLIVLAYQYTNLTSIQVAYSVSSLQPFRIATL